MGLFAKPLREIPAEAAREEPRPAPLAEPDQMPWWPAVARITALDWIPTTSPVLMS